MASPQIENGYTRIANEIMEAMIRSGLSGNQFAITLLIIRESYGWQRKATAPMGLKAMARRTGIARSSVQLALKNLRTLGIVRQEKDSGWALVKDHEKWVGGQPTGPGGASPLSKRGQPTGPQKLDFSTWRPGPKDIKKNVKKEINRAPSAVDFTGYKIKYIGEYIGRRVEEIPADDCAYLLANGRPGGDRAALEWRVGVKAQETNRG